MKLLIVTLILGSLNQAFAQTCHHATRAHTGVVKTILNADGSYEVLISGQELGDGYSYSLKGTKLEELKPQMQLSDEVIFELEDKNGLKGELLFYTKTWHVGRASCGIGRAMNPNCSTGQLKTKYVEVNFDHLNFKGLCY